MSWITQNWTQGQLNALVKIIGEENARTLLSGVQFSLVISIGASQKPKPPSILEFISTININATSVKFVARDKFRLKKDGGICSLLGDNFKEWFLSGDGKIEEPIGEQTLRYAKLRKSSLDNPIIKELGGEEKSEMALTEMFSLMEKQSNGKEGALLTNGWVNIFYVRDSAGVLRTVYVYWDGDGWNVYAYEVSYPYGWYDGFQVFSRNYPSVSQESAAS